MTGQLELLPGVPVEPAIKLTERQRFALEAIGRLQPISSDELGALLCERRGKHTADERCDWDGSNGRQCAASLRAKGLVVRKRTVGWTLPEYRPTPAGSSAQNRDGIPF